MNNTEKRDNARAQALAQLETIRELVAALNCDFDRLEELEELERTTMGFESEDDVRQRIEESALSVEVRTGWTTLDTMPEFSEFRIVLCTGGPHVEIRGELGAYNRPQYPRVLFNDWFRELEELELDTEDEEALQTFCECFYFGE